MEKRIDITPEENEAVETVFNTFTSYVNILSLLGNKALEENSTFDRKWAEAVALDIKLTKLKREIEAKYKPEGAWKSYSFDFENHQVVFTTDEEHV